MLLVYSSLVYVILADIIILEELDTEKIKQQLVDAFSL